MENLFQTILYLIFGKRWILKSMREGQKTAVFINEVELDMAKEKRRGAQTQVEKLQATLQKMDDRYHKRGDYDESLNVTAKDLQDAKENLQKAEGVVAKFDGELAQANSNLYTSRLKYDFLKAYKIRPVYGDKDFGSGVGVATTAQAPRKDVTVKPDIVK